MIDHITIKVSELFYEQVFAPLGYRLSGIFWAFDVGNGCLFEIQSTGEKPPSVAAPRPLRHSGAKQGAKRRAQTLESMP
ncbi:hypothetical protein ABID25_003027 [Mesorhizobium abyssinicae]